jgi:septal ring factor EnvC (AmiA/AmiB activator)
MCSFIISYAQDRKELENKRNKTIEEISLANELLEKNQENRISNINQIRIVNKRIALRDELIKSLEEQIENLNSDIKENIEIIEELEKDYDKVKEEYSKLIYYTYWNRNKYNTLMYFFSSDNFNQAYKRMKYVQQLTKFRKRQIEEIELIKGELKKKIDELNIKAKGVEIVMNEKENERKSLEKEKKNKEIIMSDLRRKESKLREELKEKEEMRIQLENEITRLIEEERRKYRNEKGIRKLTPEEQLLSKNFIENKGKLPWPTERGIVTNKFGKHAHPILPGITIENNGIDINTIEGAEVRAMFDGTVTRIIPILGANYAVIIRHGEYLSVYQNIISVAVKKGDKVRTKQKLGIVYTDNETKDTMLHLELWKELEKQNPEIWLSK